MSKLQKSIYFLKSLPLRIKLGTIISAIVLLSLGILTYVSLGIFENDITNMVTVMNSRTTKLLSEKVQTELDMQEKNLALIYKARVETDSKNSNLVKETFLRDSDDMVFVAALKGTGGNIKFSEGNSKFLKSIGLSKSQIVKKLTAKKSDLKRVQKGEEIIRNYSAHFGKPLLGLFVPLYRNGKVFQIMLALVRMENLNSVFGMQSARTVKNKPALYASFMIDGEGNALIHPNGEVVMKAKNMMHHPAVKKLFTINSRNAIFKYNTQNSSAFAAFQKLKNSGLAVITTIDKDLALEGVYIARFRSLLISLLIISAAVLFIYFFSKTLIRPIKNLVGATEKIREGEYETKLKKDSNDEIGELTDAFNEMTQGLQEREKLKGAFGKFVNPEIAKMILHGDLSLQGERKNVAIFFSDIRNFTGLSEKLVPEKVVDFLNEYFSLMVEIIYKANGIVDKFIGDAIMAVWGAPVTKGNEIKNAVIAALNMREAMQAFNKNRGSKDKPKIQIGIGINYGAVLAGQIGSTDRSEYTVIGDAVNVASRLESFNKPYGTDIIISSGVYEKVKDEFHCVFLGQIIVKGKTKPEKVYCVLGHKNDKSAPQSLAELRKFLGTKLDKSAFKTKSA